MYDVAEGFGTYKTYLALRMHFTSDSYDYFKYNGKVRATEQSFLKRNDKFFFRKLKKRFPKEADLVEFFVANFLTSDNWIGNLMSQESEENHKSYKKNQESRTYIFKEDMQFLVDYSHEKEIDINKLLFVKDGDHPIMLRLLLQNKISIETVIILDSYLKFVRYWDAKLDDIVWENQSRLIKKYTGFMCFDSVQCRKVLKEIIK